MKTFVNLVLPLAFVASLVSSNAVLAQVPAIEQKTAPSPVSSSIESDRTTDFKHGLFEIREDARLHRPRERGEGHEVGSA